MLKALHEVVSEPDCQLFIKQYSEYLDDINAAITDKTLNHLIKRFTFNPKKHIYPEDGWDMRRNKLFPYLSECACNGHSREDRSEMEAQIIDFARSAYPPKDREEPLNYLSLGAGELLQDYIVVANLLFLRYSHIRIVLVDPYFERRDSLLRIREFNRLITAAEEMGQRLEIFYYKSMDTYLEQDSLVPFELVVSIDFENIFKEKVFKDVLKAHQTLSETGKMFFSFDHNRLILNRDGLEAAELPQGIIRGCELDRFRTNLQNSVLTDAKQNEIHYLSLELRVCFYEWVYLIPILREKQPSQIHFTLVRPREMDYFGNFTDRYNEHFDEESLAYFLKLCTQSEVTVQLIESADEFMESKEEHSHNQPYNIITLLGYADAGQSKIKTRFESLERKWPDATKYYAVKWFDEAHQKSTCMQPDSRAEKVDKLIMEEDFKDAYLERLPCVRFGSFSHWRNWYGKVNISDDPSQIAKHAYEPTFTKQKNRTLQALIGSGFFTTASGKPASQKTPTNDLLPVEGAPEAFRHTWLEQTCISLGNSSIKSNY